MGKYAQFILGSAGCGKYCASIGRTVHIVNLDPAAEYIAYNPSIDIRDLISLEDVMSELDYGPNGGLVYCMEYLSDNLEWLRDELAEFEEDYLIFDCPGQIELYTHLNVMNRTVLALQELNYRVCSVFLIDSTFLADTTRFVSGSVAALSSMMRLELPHVNILTKLDLVKRDIKLLRQTRSALALRTGHGDANDNNYDIYGGGDDDDDDSDRNGRSNVFDFNSILSAQSSDTSSSSTTTSASTPLTAFGVPLKKDSGVVSRAARGDIVGGVFAVATDRTRHRAKPAAANAHSKRLKSVSGTTTAVDEEDDDDDEARELSVFERELEAQASALGVARPQRDTAARAAARDFDDRHRDRDQDNNIDDEENDEDEERLRESLDKYLSVDTFSLVEDITATTPPRFRALTASIGRLLEEFNMINYFPLDITNNDNTEAIMYQIDTMLQWSEDQEPTEIRDYDEDDME